MKFDPAEMAQMMDGAKTLITVMLVSSVGIGIVLGAIVALYCIFFRHRAADQSFQSGMPTVPALPTIPAQEIDATAPHSPRPPVPRANNLLSARRPQPRLNVKRRKAFATIPIVPNLPRLRSIRLL